METYTRIDAIVAGLAHAAEMGYTKPMDIAVSISVALEDYQFKIVRMGDAEFARRAARIESDRIRHQRY